ncbi:hybrid sensor histidine kinase/response regulator [Parachitinimonas caeni]|uniref:histidine kinase n=1 Tax=Parachitinimonas caeni TaxID=3031301 RepID=A0ABT7DQX3_9NEIS|nr:Hpt domain-containing protein [Parachitinimonas caeni]MDK2122482.1 Hpt domain-containing protein [Parachitinimonas caeni]
MSVQTEFDMGSLIWVKGEIDQAIDRARQSIQLFVEKNDSAQLKFCQTHLHQVTGAIEMVGLDGAARFSEELEQFVAAIERNEIAGNETHIELIGASAKAVANFLESLINGSPNVALKLYPHYKKLRDTRGLDETSASDLFFPALSAKLPQSVASSKMEEAQIANFIKSARARFEAGLLKWLKGPRAEGAAWMAQGLFGISRTQSSSLQKGFWWSAGAMCEGLGDFSGPIDINVQQLLSRINLQLRRLSDGSGKVAERLFRDVLFVVAHIKSKSPHVALVKLTYDLKSLLPQAGIEEDANLIARKQLAREIKDLIGHAKDNWARYCTGSQDRIGQFVEYIQQVESRKAGIDLPQLGELLAAVRTAAEATKGNVSESSALEIATALLLIENAILVYPERSEDFPQQAAAMLTRLRDGGAGSTDLPLLDEVSRRAQEKMLLAQVSQEIQANLRQIEQILDTFFRDTSTRSELKSLDGFIRQIQGALMMMDERTASELLGASAEIITKCQNDAYEPEQAELELLAEALSSLGFYIEATQRGDADRESIILPFLRRLKGEPETSIAIPQAEELVLEQEEPQAPSAPTAVAPVTATAIPQEEIPTVIEENKVEPVPSATPTTSSTPAAVSDAAIDAELLEVYLEEAVEVLASVSEQMAICRDRPNDRDALTIIRRSFHTLKGSGRMVGLYNIGEVAWAVEQVMNKWLQDERAATPSLLTLIQMAHDSFAHWVEQLQSTGEALVESSKISTLAETLKSGQEPEIPQSEPVAVPPVQVEAVEETPAELVIGSVNITPTLFGIFVEEAERHIAALRDANVAASAAGQMNKEFVHAAHTLCGIANTTGFSPLGELGHALETAAQSHDKHSYPVEAAAASMFEQAIEHAEQMLAAIRTKHYPEAVEPLVNELLSWSSEVAAKQSAAAAASAELTLPQVDFDLELDVAPQEHVATEISLRPDAEEAFNLDFGSTLQDEVSSTEPSEGLDISLDFELEASAPPVLEVQEAAEESALSLESAQDLRTVEETPALATPTFDLELDLDVSTAEELVVEEAPAMAETLLPVAAEETADLDLDLTLPAESAAPLDLDFGSAEVIEQSSHESQEELTELSLPDSTPELEAEEPAELLDLSLELDQPASPDLEVPVAPALPAVQIDVSPDHDLELEIDTSAQIELIEEPDLQAVELEDETPALLAVEDEPVLAEAPQHQEVLAEEAILLEESDLGEFASSTDGTLVEPELDTLLVTATDEPEVIVPVEQIQEVISVEPELVVALEEHEEPETPQQAESSISIEEAPISLEFDTSAVEVLTLEETDTASFVPQDALDATDTVPGLATKAAEIQVSDDLDDQLLPIFIEEAQELMPQISADLRSWRGDLANTEYPDSLRRVLHTLKGSARMAGAMRLGEATHNMETRLLNAGERVPQELLDGLDTDFDLVTELYDELTGQKKPSAAAAAQQAAQASTAAMMPALGLVDTDAARASIRVRADLLDRLVNQAGEVSIARSRIESEMQALKQSLLDLTDNVGRLRAQLREIEIQAESQMQSRLAHTAVQPDFDPLEFDRFSRLQELTRFMAESVNDVATVQHNLLKNLDESTAALQQQGRMTKDLQQELMRVRMVPFSSVSERLYRLVRQTGKEVGKKVNLELRGGRVEIDRSVLEKMVSPFEHMLRNAIGHGLENPDQRAAAGKSEFGEIQIEARQEGNELVVTLHDDGAGLNLSKIRAKAIERNLITADSNLSDNQVMQLIFEAGFSTATEVTQLSGRGIGMDVVKSEIADIGGHVDVTSEAGKGTTFTIHLPLTLAVTQAVLVKVGNKQYAIPSVMVEQVQELKQSALERVYEAGYIEWLGNQYPFFYMPRLLNDHETMAEQKRYNTIVLLRSGTQRIALHVDHLMKNQEVVVKNIGPQLIRVAGIAGATVLGNGDIVLILNPLQLLQRLVDAGSLSAVPGKGPAQTTGIPSAAAQEALHVASAVMVVDDSLTVRKITGRLLAREGYQVLTAKDGVDALQQLQDTKPDVMLLDVEMPRMDGFELTRNIRTNAETRDIPIIMITSRTADKHRNYALELGVNVFLGKPYQEDELLEHIRRLIDQRITA